MIDTGRLNRAQHQAVKQLQVMQDSAGVNRQIPESIAPARNTAPIRTSGKMRDPRPGRRLADAAQGLPETTCAD